MNIEKIISFEQLSGDQRELAETVGLEVYKILIENFGGVNFTFQNGRPFLKKSATKKFKKISMASIIVNSPKNTIFPKKPCIKLCAKNRKLSL